MTRAAIPPLAALFLGGCSFFGPQPYDAYVPIVNNQDVLNSDKIICRQMAMGYHEPLNLNNIGTAAVSGAGNNAAGAAINPLVPVIGAVGAAGAQTLSSLNILSNKQRKVYAICLHDKGQKSGAYEVFDPN